MLCPFCEAKCSSAEDWCLACGAYLGLLKRKPRHLVKCANLTIALGCGFFLALFWHVFMPLTEGWPAGQPNGWFWCQLGLATFLLALGLRARQHLMLQRYMPLGRKKGQPLTPPIGEEETSVSSGM